MAAPALVEREHELELIEDTLAAAATGSGRALVLEGEAGIGKTVLLARARELATELGFHSYAARAGVFERSFAFGMARELFEAAVVRASAGERRRLFEGSAELAAALLGVDPGGGRSPTSPAPDENALDHGLYWLVANLAERGPIALLLDDVHWCDEPTLRWLLYLLRRIDGLGVAVVLATRSGEPDAPRQLLGAIAAEPAAQVATLRPLGEGGTAALLKREYGGAVDPRFSLACHEWTAGNPMFVSNLASELVAEGIEPVEESVPGMRRLAPPTITRVTLLRLARLPPDAVALAQALAVLRSARDLTIAGELAGLESDATSAATDALLAAGILEPGHPPRFSHPLVASVVYEDLPLTRRASDHARAARMLGDAGARPERVVAQLLRSSPAGEAWRVDALMSAAERDLARGSARTAIGLLRRAVEEPPDDERLPDVLRTLGLAQSLAGDKAAVESLRYALEASADSVQRGTISLLLSRLLVRAGLNAEAVDVLEPAIEALDHDEDDLRLQLEAALLTAARLDVRLARLAGTRVEQLGADLDSDTHGGRLIAAQLAWAATAIGRSVVSAVELARRALGDGRLIAESPITPDGYLLPIFLLSVCDELDDADRYCARAIALARQTGSGPAYAGTACIRSGVAYLAGRLADAEVLARDALRLGEQAPDIMLVAGLARAYLSNVLIDRGEVAEASSLLGETARLDQLPYAWGAELLFAAGRARLAEQKAPEALELFLACGERCLEHQVKNPAWLPWRSQAALVLRQLGDNTRAAELIEEEVQRARRFGARRPLGVALRASAMIEGGAPALELLRESRDVLAESPAKLEYARTLVALGGKLRRAGQRSEARTPLTEALAVAERCHAAALALEADTELQACGARPRSVMRHGADSLTPSERRVCEMAATGMSNPQIAQALFVTRATVESHLHSSYRKLHLSGRKQLVEALAEATTGIEPV